MGSDDAMRRSRASAVILSRQLSSSDLMTRFPVDPDRSWDKGEARGRGGDPHRFSGLMFESGIDRSASPSEHMTALLERLQPVIGSIRAFAEDARISDPEVVPLRVTLEIEASKAEVGVELTANCMRAVTSLGGNFGFEVDFVDAVS
jgi:hypothetical protein